MTDDLVITREGKVLRVTFNRPAKKNALTSAMYRAAEAALQDADRDDGIGAVVFSGAAGTFTAGNDIGDFLAGTREKDGAPGLRFIRALAACDTPMVAAVEGNAIGIGTTMVFHCDLAYAAPNAFFRMPFVDLGLVPEAASSLLVPMRVGMVRATELFMLGDPIRAEEAARVGMLNAVVEPEKLLGFAMTQAARLADKPRAALAATRRLIRGDKAAVLARIDMEMVAFEAALQSPDARAAFTAFLAKKAG